LTDVVELKNECDVAHEPWSMGGEGDEIKVLRIVDHGNILEASFILGLSTMSSSRNGRLETWKGVTLGVHKGRPRWKRAA